MARLSNGEARRARASRHASRSWTCPCGRVVWGNGGKSSHRRACRTYKVHRYVQLGRRLASAPEAGGWAQYSRRMAEMLFEQLRVDLRGELGP